MGHVETFDHTADLGLRIHGADLADFFQTAAEGLLDVVVSNRKDVQPLLRRQIRLRSDSLPDLLVDWLNELIYLLETEHLIFGQFEVQVDRQPLTLVATVLGEPIDADRHILDHEVKSATRHGVRLVEGASGWDGEVILDI